MATSYRRQRKFIKVLTTIINPFIVISLVLLQLFIYYLLIFEIHNIPYVTTISTILSLIVVTYIYNTDNNISSKLTWTVVCMVFSLTGILFYLLYGNGKSLPKKNAKKINDYLSDKIIDNNLINELDDLIAYKHVRTLNYSTDGYVMYKNTPNTFFNDGKKLYYDLLEKIKNAKKFIFIEFFIISEGSVLNEIMALLQDKAQEGIDIKIIYDAFGSGALKNKTVNKIKNIINIEIIAYNPLRSYSPQANYRDHRKIVVIDGIYAYTGGVNLADEYVHRKLKYGHWRDNGLLIEGEGCYSYTLLFAQNWYMSTKQMLLIEDYKPIYQTHKAQGYIFPYGDSPINKNNASYNLFLSLINNATKSIYISTPYFIIDSNFIDAIKNAIKIGIDVKVLIPNITDKKLLFPTTLAHLKNIILNGGEVYKYTPGFNHAKTIIVDSKYAYIGTVNVDYRSLFVNYECGNLLINTTTIKEIEQDFLDTLKISKKMGIQEWKQRPLKSKFAAFIFTLLGPLL